MGFFFQEWQKRNAKIVWLTFRANLERLFTEKKNV